MKNKFFHSVQRECRCQAWRKNAYAVISAAACRENAQLGLPKVPGIIADGDERWWCN